jgi:hypothetical protein
VNILIVGADLGAKHGNKPPGDALCGGADGPRHRAGHSATWTQERILLDTLSNGPRLGRTVRDSADGRLLHEEP